MRNFAKNTDAIFPKIVDFLTYRFCLVSQNSFSRKFLEIRKKLFFAKVIVRWKPKGYLQRTRIPKELHQNLEEADSFYSVQCVGVLYCLLCIVRWCTVLFTLYSVLVYCTVYSVQCVGVLYCLLQLTPDYLKSNVFWQHFFILICICRKKCLGKRLKILF